MEPSPAAPADFAGDLAAPKPRPLGRVYKYYDLILAGFVTVLLCTNLISAPKRVQIGGFVFGAGVLFFPISYLFGDILTEVYGYKRSRKVVWAGFGALVFATFMSQVVLRMPADPSWGLGVRLDGSYVVPSGEKLTVSSAQAEQSGRLGDRLRRDLAGRAGVDGRVLRGRVRQLVHAGEDEDPHPRPVALDPHDRLDDRGRGGRLRCCSTRSRSMVSGRTSA